MPEGKFAAVADQLFKVGAIKFGAFKLKLHETQPDAPLSPIYLNLRTPDNPKPGPLTKELLLEAASLMHTLLDAAAFVGDIDFRYVAGIPNAGDPFADALMTMLPQSIEQLHLGKAEVDGKRMITGVRETDFETGKAILLIDDLITQADSKFEAARAAEHDGLIVRDLLVLVDRQQGGAEQLREWGYWLLAVFTLDQLLDHYVQTGKIGQDKADEVRKYIAENRA